MRIFKRKKNKQINYGKKRNFRENILVIGKAGSNKPEKIIIRKEDFKNLNSPNEMIFGRAGSGRAYHPDSVN